MEYLAASSPTAKFARAARLRRADRGLPQRLLECGAGWVWYHGLHDVTVNTLVNNVVFY